MMILVPLFRLSSFGCCFCSYSKLLPLPDFRMMKNPPNIEENPEKEKLQQHQKSSVVFCFCDFFVV